MQFTGTLRTWHDDRGFGFIAPRHGGPEVFVHISAFPRDGSRPTVGEVLSYELGRGKDGRPQATRVLRAAIGTPPPPAPKARSRSSSRLLSSLLMLALVAGVGIFAFKRSEAYRHRRQLEAQAPMPTTEADSSTGFHCDGRTRCPQMTSCAEAKWFINHCPGTKMDGDHDGVPCERQWCSR